MYVARSGLEKRFILILIQFLEIFFEIFSTIRVIQNTKK